MLAIETRREESRLPTGQAGDWPTEKLYCRARLSKTGPMRQRGELYRKGSPAGEIESIYRKRLCARAQGEGHTGGAVRESSEGLH